MNNCIKSTEQFYCHECGEDTYFTHCKSCKQYCACNESEYLKELLRQSIKDIDNRKNLTNYLMDKYSPVLKRLSKT